MAFCQMLCVLSDDEVCMRLFAGIRTFPAVAGMVVNRVGPKVGGAAHLAVRLTPVQQCAL